MSSKKKPERSETEADAIEREKSRPGDEVQGDRVGGDKIRVGTISRSSGIAIGRGASATVSYATPGEELARLFEAIYKQIEARPADPDVEKAELVETVQKVEQEAVKGEQANPNKVERWLKTLALMAPDIFEVAVATLTSPAAGVAAIIRKVAEKAKQEAGTA